jgi:hypothetical protein
VGNWRFLGRLGSRLRFLAISINVVVCFAEVESAKLNGGFLHLAIARHPDCLFLVKNATLVALRASSCCLESCGNEAAGRNWNRRSGAVGLVLLLRCGEGCTGCVG